MQHFDSTISWRGSSCAIYKPLDFYCYLYHFSEPIGSSNPRGQAGHYLGACHDLDTRDFLHKQGRAARLTQVAVEQGRELVLVRLWRVDSWEESRDLEHLLKRRHNSPVFCPVCNPRLGPDLLVRLREGHWPLALHSRVGRRRPSPRWQNQSWKGGDAR